MIFRLIVKSAVVGGAVHYSRELGVWGDSKKTEEIFQEIGNHITPHVVNLTKQVPVELPQLPSTGELGYLTKHYYNNGVKNTIHFIEMLPCNMGRWTMKGYVAVQDALNAGHSATGSVVEISKK